MAPLQNGASICKLFPLFKKTWKRRRKMCTFPVPQRERTPRKGGQRRPEEGPVPELRCRLESLGKGKRKEEQQQPFPSIFGNLSARASSFLADPQFSVSCFPFSQNHPMGKATHLSPQHCLHFWKSKYVPFPLNFGDL